MNQPNRTPHQRQALQSFDLFCSGGRPQTGLPDGSIPELCEVAREELIAAFLQTHPKYRDCESLVTTCLPARVRVHQQWWSEATRAKCDA